MGKRFAGIIRFSVSLALITSLAACGGKTVMDAYVLKDGYLAGDSSKGIRPAKNLIVWPLLNNATGSKAKGIELKLTDVFIDKFYLEGEFDSVIIISDDRAKDLLSRAGEELGLKRKPKDVDSGLVAAKVGELAAGDAIFVGVISDYDEDKVDKMVESVTSGTFALIDAREKAYTNLDSFTPLKLLWRANIKEVSTETLVTGRDSLDNTARSMIDKIVSRLISDFSSAQKIERQDFDKKIAELRGRSETHLRKDEFDKAVAVWNEVLKMDPGNIEAESQIEYISQKKKEAEERAKAEALKKEIDGLKKEARTLTKDGDLKGAIDKYTAVLEKDAEDKEAQRSIEKLQSRIAEEEERAKQKEISRLLYMAQKQFSENKFEEAIETAKKVLELHPENEKAQAIINDSNINLENIRAKEAEAAREAEKVKVPEEPKAEEKVIEKEVVKEAESEPATEEAVEEKPEKKVVPAGPETAGESPELEEIRKRAMEYFDREEYQKSYEEWQKILELDPEDSQAKEMLETTDMLIKALQ